MASVNITTEYIGRFFKLPEADAKAIFDGLERLEFSHAENIVTAGDAADGMYFIEDGKVDVINDEGESVNEMSAGQYFGEYGVIADEPRMTSCRARGKVIVYRMSSEQLLAVIAKKPAVAGYLLKSVYGQLSVKHSKLLEMARARRGILSMPARKSDRKTLILTYAAVLLVFAAVFLFCPEENAGPVWMAVPALFFLIHNIMTRRTLETFILSITLTSRIAMGTDFAAGLVNALLDGITTRDTANTMLIMALMGGVTALLDAAGGISALRRPAEKSIKTGRGALFAMLGILFLIFIDDYLNLMAAAFCLVGIMDKNKIPREVPALLGTSATAVCSVVPISVWGAFLCGTITMCVGENGGAIFLKSLGCNFATVAALIGALLLCFGILPKSRAINDAEKRVKDGGKLWPEGSEKYFLAEDDNEIYGSVKNLIIPIAVMVIASVAGGMFQSGGAFALDASVGLVVTLVVMFFLYCGQSLMTPEKFFDCLISGIQNSMLSIILLLLTVCFSNCLQAMNFGLLAEGNISELLAGVSFLIPAVIYVVFTLLTVLLGSSWGMYGIGIPVAVHLAGALSLNLPLCLGAIMAAGISGDNLMPYVSESSLLASAIGCEPKVARKLRLSYWSVLALITVIAYVVAGVTLQ